MCICNFQRLLNKQHMIDFHFAEHGTFSVEKFSKKIQEAKSYLLKNMDGKITFNKTNDENNKALQVNGIHYRVSNIWWEILIKGKTTHYLDCYLSNCNEYMEVSLHEII